MGRKPTENRKPTPKQGDFLDWVWENVKAFLIAIVLAIIIKTSIVEAYKIPSSSMEDTLLVGDFLIANKFIYGARLPLVDWRLPAFTKPHAGDVVIFKFPGDGITNYIKRCVAIAGDTVELRDKALFVNGQQFPNPPHSKFVENSIQQRPGGQDDTRDNFGPYVVPKDCFFMMGDNRDRSYDSRFWGPVHERFILGEAMFIHWSWQAHDEAPEITPLDPLSVPRAFLYHVTHPEEVRWNRLLNDID